MISKLLKFQDLQFHEDDRAQRLLDCFPEIRGQINITYVRTPRHIVAWHKHMEQSDTWICLQGSFKVGIKKPHDPDVHWIYLSDRKPESLHIPPDHYHGYMALEPNSILMYHTSEKYNVHDEMRQPVGSFDEDWSIQQK